VPADPVSARLMALDAIWTDVVFVAHSVIAS
jgi:hypothetical protein